MNNFSLNPPRRILLVKPSSMGDVIHALPVAAALHRAWPEAEIRWLIDPAWEPLVKDHPAIAGTILFPRENFRGLLGWGRSVLWACTLRSWKPDLAIDLQGLLRSALMARLSGASHVVGLSDAREGASLFYSSTAQVDKKEHAIMRYLAVLDLDFFRRWGQAIILDRKIHDSCFSDSHPVKNNSLTPSFLEFFLPEGKLPFGFSVNQPYVVLHPYARGDGKNLTREQVVAFATSLKEVPVILIGKGLPMRQLPPNVVDWSGKTTLLELSSILRKASFIVSSDSGPMHLAAALQPSKTLAIHRWSDPLRVGPWHPASLVWKNGIIVRADQLSEELRAAGRTPTLTEMREIGSRVLKEIAAKEHKDAREKSEGGLLLPL